MVATEVHSMPLDNVHIREDPASVQLSGKILIEGDGIEVILNYTSLACLSSLQRSVIVVSWRASLASSKII
jgi:hypothetical protein